MTCSRQHQVTSLTIPYHLATSSNVVLVSQQSTRRRFFASIGVQTLWGLNGRASLRMNSIPPRRAAYMVVQLNSTPAEQDEERFFIVATFSLLRAVTGCLKRDNAEAAPLECEDDTRWTSEGTRTPCVMGFMHLSMIEINPVIVSEPNHFLDHFQHSAETRPTFTKNIAFTDYCSGTEGYYVLILSTVCFTD